MSKRRKLTIPFGPNETGADPQFGNIIDLPGGYKRQTTVIRLATSNNATGTDDAKYWSRLTFNFPECLGIKETLDNKAKSTACIPTLEMDVSINVPEIHDVKLDMVKRDREYEDNVTFNDAKDGLTWDVVPRTFSLILTGEDQLIKEVPDFEDETKTVSTTLSDFQRASASHAIWAYFNTPTDPLNTGGIATIIAPNTAFGKQWLYGKTSGQDVGLSYYHVAQSYIGRDRDGLAPWGGETSTINNIPSKGFLLLKDHVNLFIKMGGGLDRKYNFELRLSIDYKTKSVPLSSLLVWKQQLTEFVPKQLQWRGHSTTASTTANGWDFLISRGTVKETGIGNDPSSSTDFPPIKE